MSRLIPFLAIVALAAAQTPARAQVAPKALVTQAVEAHGGGAALVKAKAFVRSAKGEIVSFGASARAALELTYQAPDKGRWSFELDAGTQKVAVTLGLAGNQGFRSSGGAVKELTKQEMEDPVIEAYYHSLVSLVPLLDGPELAALPETKVNNEPALGVRVSAKGKPEIKLYFDKKTNLLVKGERPGREGGIDVVREYVYSDHKDFDGVKLPGRQLELLNGRKVAEWIISGYKFPARVEEAVFTKP